MNKKVVVNFYTNAAPHTHARPIRISKDAPLNKNPLRHSTDFEKRNSKPIKRFCKPVARQKIPKIKGALRKFLPKQQAPETPYTTVKINAGTMFTRIILYTDFQIFDIQSGDFFATGFTNFYKSKFVAQSNWSAA